MAKEKKIKSYQSLAQQILDSEVPRKPTRTKSKTRKAEEEEYVGDKLTHKILKQARQQQEELEEQYGVGATGRVKFGKKRKQASSNRTKISLGPQELGDSSDEDDEDGDLNFKDEGGSQDVCPVVMEEDEKAMQAFMSHEDRHRRTLADVILEKIRDKQTEITSQMSETPSVVGSQVDEKVVSVFKGVGQILSKYRSGKLPKAFKVIPKLSNWEEVLHLTEPEKWTAATMFQATRIFSSSLSAAHAQRFYNLVLLPRVRDDISEYKRLNFHLYMSLKKALFKPAAFFKGILLPLCESGTCTLREALIIGSVLAKTSIPMLHSSAALLKIAEMDYSGASSIFLRALLEKKYALPYRVVDAVVFHFLRFQNDPRELPVLWHQSLLTFVQRYKEDMSVEQKEALLELIRSKAHHDITPEIRREIVNSKCRDLGELYINRQQAKGPAQMQTD